MYSVLNIQVGLRDSRKQNFKNQKYISTTLNHHDILQVPSSR